MKTALSLALLATLALGSAARAEVKRPTTEEARQLLLDGNRYYKVRDFDQAIELYKKGALIEQAPVFWYNLGQAFRQQGKYKEAIWYYKRYLADPENEEGSRHADHFVDEMQKELDKRAQNETPVDPAPGVTSTPTTPAATPAPAPEPEADADPTIPALVPQAEEAPPRWYQDKVGWILVGSGVAVAAAGVYFIAHAGTLEDGALGRQSVLDQAKTSRVAGITLTAAGSAVLLSGVIKFALTRRHHAPVVTASATGQGVWLSVAGRF